MLPYRQRCPPSQVSHSNLRIYHRCAADFIRFTVYCLWLLPSAPDFDPLSKQVRSLAAEAPFDNPSPVFDPHITFLSGLSLETDVEELGRKVQQGLKDWHDSARGSRGSLELELDLEEPINGGSYYTAVIYPVAQASPSSSSVGGAAYSRLISGRTELENILRSFYPPAPPGFTPKPYFPHLSLQYSASSQPELASITQKFITTERAKGTLLQRVMVDRCALMRLEGEVPEWKTVAVCKLDGREVEHDSGTA